LSVEVHRDPLGLDRLFVMAAEFNASFEVHGNCTLQGLGTVQGRDLYFRARHHGWSFDVADTAGNLPSDGYRDSDGFYCEGQYPNAGWMPLEEAVAIIETCLRQFAQEDWQTLDL
jgi:hypothetical protein